MEHEEWCSQESYCCPCGHKKDIDSLKSLLRSAHEIIKTVEFAHSDRDGKVCECYFCGGDKIMDFEKHYDGCKLGEWLTAYSSLTSSKSGMGE